MKTVIGNIAFITKYKYSAHMSKSEYDVLELEDKLEVAREKVACEKDGVAYKSKGRDYSLKYGQRLSLCYIAFGKVDARNDLEVIAEASVINHPDEMFVRSEGRARAFDKALDIIFGSPYLLKVLGITDVMAARQQFVDEFNAERDSKVK